MHKGLTRKYPMLHYSLFVAINISSCSTIVAQNPFKQNLRNRIYTPLKDILKTMNALCSLVHLKATWWKLACAVFSPCVAFGI